MGGVLMQASIPHTPAVGASRQSLAPIEAVVARVRTLAQRRALWLAEVAARDRAEAPWSELSPGLRRALLDLDAPEAEARFFEQDPRARLLGARAEELAAMVRQGSDSRFGQLVRALALEPRELDLLQVCVAAAIDPGLGAVLAFVGGDVARRHPTEWLAARLCGHGRGSLWSPVSALAQWEVLIADEADPGEPPPLRVDPFVLGYLHGRTEIDAVLLRCMTVIEGRTPLAAWPLPALRERIGAALEAEIPARVVVVGPPGSGRRTLSACLCESLGMTLLAIDTDAIADDEWASAQRRAQRQALLHGCALAWHGSRVARALRGGLVRLPLEFLVAEPPAELRSEPGWLEARVTMPRLDSSERARLWARVLPAVEAWAPGESRRLAERFSVQIGDIVHIAAQGVTSRADAERLARETTRGRLGELGTLLDCPFRREDLQVPERLGHQLDELLFEARERIRFWEEEHARRLFPRGTGLVALLSGAPGTGKTMTGQVVAAELGLDLFRIDLAATVSKYIGETAKNLRRLFARAADMNAVLLFDEADALFSKRTDVRDAHDRHANADTNYLLQLVEDYPGIALLATNRRQNMDDAFVRRVRYLLYFPRPEAVQRRAIWSAIVRQLGGEEAARAVADELDHLADTIDSTGAQIKNAVLGAAFFAREQETPMRIEHIRRGLERELGNQGRSLPGHPATRSGRERAA
jgi:hypothetical protein